MNEDSANMRVQVTRKGRVPLTRVVIIGKKENRYKPRKA
jgi:hypothetical protein